MMTIHEQGWATGPRVLNEKCKSQDLACPIDTMAEYAYNYHIADTYEEAINGEDDNIHR